METKKQIVDPYNEFIRFIKEEYKDTESGIWLRAVGATLAKSFLESTGIKVTPLTTLRYLEAMKSSKIIDMRVMAGTQRAREIQLNAALNK